MSKIITIFTSLLEDNEKLIKNVDRRIVVHPPKEIVEHVQNKKKTSTFSCEYITSGKIQNPHTGEVLCPFTKWIEKVLSIPGFFD